MGVDELDPEYTTALLHRKSLMEWPVAFPRILTNNDPLAAIESLIDLYVEIDMAVQPVAQGMSAALHASRFPNVVVAPIVLSATEHTRIACSLLVIQIYYRLALHFSSDWADAFPANFIRGLQPWQRVQAISVESFLQTCTQPYNFSSYMLLDERYTCRECMSQKYTYIRRYIQATEFPAELPDQFLHRTLSQSFLYATRRNQRVHLPPWRTEETDAGHPSNASLLDTQLRNHGWVMYEALGPSRQFFFSTTDNCRQALLHLGVLFWDNSRLAACALTDSASILELAAHLGAEMRRITTANNRNWQLTYGHSPVLIAKEKASQIVKWTRCPIQCSLEEWLYQKVALLRLANGRPPIPSKYLEPGMLCYLCGLDGHQGRYCNESAWSDDETRP